MRYTVRISNWPVREGELRDVKRVYGNDVTTYEAKVVFSEDPVADIVNVLDRIEHDSDDEVVAIIIDAPEFVRQCICSACQNVPALLGLSILKPEFLRDDTGRCISCGKTPEGRDIFAFRGFREINPDSGSCGFLSATDP